MQSFRDEQLPAIYALAKAFAVCDQWYSEVPGPTQPNRLYMIAATSRGLAHNDWGQVFDKSVQTIYNQLEAQRKSWAVYYVDDNEACKFESLSHANSYGDSARKH